MRYYSILADLTAKVSDCFHLTAFACQDADAGSVAQNSAELMALEHSDYPTFGV
jgi:hypothetical protein